MHSAFIVCIFMIVTRIEGQFLNNQRANDKDNRQVRSSLKLLGIIVQEDLRWGEQVALMTKKASRKIWVMRRMKNLGLDGKKTISGFF